MGVEGEAAGPEVGVVGANTQISRAPRSCRGFGEEAPLALESSGNQEQDGVSVDDRCERDRDVGILTA